MFSFHNSNYLWGLLLLIIPIGLFFFVLYWKQKRIAIFRESCLTNPLINTSSDKLVKLKFFTVLISLGLLVASAANPQKQIKRSPRDLKGIDIIFVVDVSKSMLAEDLKSSRLESAKQLVSGLIKSMNDNRFGLVIFGEQPFLQMPLTTDLMAASMFINSISVDAVPEQGTAIGKALALADASLNTNERKHKAIILISDGEDHGSTARDAAKQAYGHGAVIFTIGLGSRAGAPIREEGSKVYKKDETGSVIISKLNETLLKEIAEIAGGRYYPLINTDQIIPLVVKDISHLEKKSFQANDDDNYTSFFWTFLSIAIFLLVIEVFIPEVKRKYKSL